MWASEMKGNPFYTPQKAQAGGSYDPTYGGYSVYEPYSNFTSAMIQSDIQKWMQSEFPELFDFNTGQLNTGGIGSSGDVSRNPTFGQFAKDPRVFDEIQAAASKYGVPANLLKVMIGRESSGDWSGSNTGQVYLPERGHYIVGYTGITQPAAAAWGYEWGDLVGNRAMQIDAMANGLSRLYQQYGGQYGWDGVIATYYSGDPTAATTPSDSYQYGTTQQYVQDVKSWWAQEDDWTRANGGSLWSEGGGTGVASPSTPEWGSVNRWDGYVTNAAQQYGVPANLLKAIMRVESNGVPGALSAAGAVGLMQVMPGMHGLSAEQLADPVTNINKGAEILRNNYNQYGDWELAAKSYLAGDPYSEAFDAAGSNVHSYWSRVNQYWDALDAEISGVFGGESTGDPGPVTNISAIWGNQQFEVTQEHGPTQWARDNPWMYEYSYDVLGELGHPGIDVGMPVGTAMYSPVGGTVIVAGGSGAYQNRIGDNSPQTGELRIRLDNGHELILGHLSGIYVQAGARVNPGQLVAASGYPDAAHLHLEYRVPDASMNGGWKAIDPRQALRGVFTGSLTSPTSTPGINRPMTYDELLMAAAQGKPVDYGQPLSSGSSWNLWLRQAMAGEIPNRRNDTSSWAGRDRGSSGTPTLPGFGSFNPITQNAMR